MCNKTNCIYERKLELYLNFVDHTFTEMNVELETEGGVEARNDCDHNPLEGESVSRVALDSTELPAAEMVKLWAEQDKYVDLLEARLRELEEKGRGDTSRREQMLVMRLTAKEQELQEMAAQIAELKAAQAPTSAQLRQTLLDPAVNLVIQKLTKECDQLKKAAEEAQNELAAWKFTPDSSTGKRLMAKCRQLYQENEDLGKMIASGRLAKLEGELALQKNLTEEMKKNQQEMDEFMGELDEDVEGMQSTIYYLQQQLREAKETIAKLESQIGTNKETETPDPGDIKTELKAEQSESTAEAGVRVCIDTRMMEGKRSDDSEDGGEAKEDKTSEDSSAGGKKGRGRGRANRSEADGNAITEVCNIYQCIHYISFSCR